MSEQYEQAARVVLVKPDDILVFSRVRTLEPEDIERSLPRLKEVTGVRTILFFEDDVDISAIPIAQLRALLDEREAADA